MPNLMEARDAVLRDRRAAAAKLYAAIVHRHETPEPNDVGSLSLAMELLGLTDADLADDVKAARRIAHLSGIVLSGEAYDDVIEPMKAEVRSAAASAKGVLAKMVLGLGDNWNDFYNWCIQYLAYEEFRALRNEFEEAREKYNAAELQLRGKRHTLSSWASELEALKKNERLFPPDTDAAAPSTPQEPAATAVATAPASTVAGTASEEDEDGDLFVGGED